MKIALVYPPSINTIRTTLPGFVDESEGVFPPLGILYIASYLKSRAGNIDIKVIDAPSENLDYEGVRGELSKFAPDIVGVTFWTFSLCDSLEICRIAKKISPKTTVVAGGPHINIYPNETLSQDCVDFAICGDGEKAFYELVSRFAGSRDFADSPNLYYKEDGEIKKSRSEYAEQDLDSLPHPDRTLTDFSKYRTILDPGGPVTTMITSRGCPYGCTFCFQRHTGWRPRSPDDIIGEMAECVALGIKNFFIFDETFTVDKKRVAEFCAKLKSSGLGAVWSCRARVDTVDEGMLDEMKSAGLGRISFGVESGDVEVLRQLDKRISVEKVAEVFRAARRGGITTLADFMVGCPGETRDATRKTVDFAISLGADYAQFSLLTLLPATKLYERALAEGIVARDVWRDYALAPSPSFKPPIWNYYSEDDARRVLVAAYKRFYLRIPWIFKRLLAVRTFYQLKIYIKAGVNLIISVFKKR